MKYIYVYIFFNIKFDFKKVLNIRLRKNITQAVYLQTDVLTRYNRLHQYIKF
jgi:hypothetical protein